ncbi:hypothetical protein M3Y99_01617900 [Aphelenchoides fujianensis]|nr:hypothetical protein M3Y99_01617900 [Aphelenchoides fujianensis]
MKSALLILLFGFAAVALADDSNNPVCDVCVRILDDFKDDLTGSNAQDILDRVCDDVNQGLGTLDDTTCKDGVDTFFLMIRALYDAGESSEDICDLYGLCTNWDDSFLRRLKAIGKKNRLAKFAKH